MPAPLDFLARQIAFFTDPIFAFVNDQNGQPVFVGIANRGSDLTGAYWLVAKFVRDSRGYLNFILLSPRGSIFSNYASLDYAPDGLTYTAFPDYNV